jgi:hydroxyacylglutathione hydrolase
LTLFKLSGINKFSNVAESAKYEVFKFVGDEEWQENCYLITNLDFGTCLIVDPGSDPSVIVREIELRNLKAIGILITHGHHDHVGALGELANCLRVPVALHELDIPLTKRAHNYAAVMARIFMRRIMPENFLEFTKNNLLGFKGLEIIHTPGHTPGSLCFKIDGFMFTGDTLLFKSVGRTDIPGGDLKRLKQSISKLFENFKDATLILPGHGDAWAFTDALVWWENARKDPKPYDYFGKP